MTIRLTGSTSGYTEVTAPAVAGSNTLVLPTGNGTADQALVTNGSGTLSFADRGRMVLETAKSATGTEVDFTGIPSWVKKITVMFDGVSTNGSSIPIIQLGNSGGIETTSYSGQGDSFTASSGALNIFSSTAHTIGFNLAANGAYIGSGFLRGISTIIKFNSNTWVISSYASQSAGASAAATGTKTLSDTLTQVRITTVNGTDTFDAGSINLLLEG